MRQPSSKSFRLTLLAIAVLVLLAIGTLFFLPSRSSPANQPVAIMMTATMLSNTFAPTQAAAFATQRPAAGGNGGQGKAGEAFGTPMPDSLSIDQRSETTLSQPNQPKRVVLKNATLNLTVQDPPGKLNEIAAMADEMGGWVVNSSTSKRRAPNGQDLIYGDITVRIPAERLDEALGRIKTDILSVNTENITGQDVTQQYIDMSSRLKNLESAEQQLQTIMDTATKVQDVLAIYNQLVATRGEIESIKGQLQYFDQAAAFSMIQIALAPEQPGPVQAQTVGWNLNKTVENALGSLVRLVQFVVDLGVSVIIVAGPFILLLGIPVVWFIRRRRRPTPVSPTD